MAFIQTVSLFTYSSSQVPIFEGEHYEYWSIQMQTFFISLDFWDVIDDEEYEEPSEDNEDCEKLQKEFKRKDAMALRYIQQGVGKSIFPRIFGVKKAKDAWEILMQEFQGTEKTIALKLQSLWRDFDNLQMEERESVRVFSSRVAETVNQIKSCGDTITDKRVAEKMLRCLPPKFDHVAAAIEESKDLSKMTIYELTGSLLAHEQRINRSSNQSTTEQAFQSKQTSKGGSNNYGEHNRGSNQTKQKDSYWKKGDKQSKWKGKQTQISGGIIRQLTVSRTPQQNSVAERKNRTIVEMARSMLKGKGLPNLYWAEAVNTAVYILNRSPTKAVRNKTPYEAWNKKKPMVDHFKIFGSTAYALIPSQNREKFDEKGQKLVFVGYSDESKGYRLLDPTTNKITVSRDVVFDEAASWDWKGKEVVDQTPYHFVDPLTFQAGPSQVENLEHNPNPTPRSEEESDPESPPRKTRSLQDIYESCELGLFSSEPQSFEKASKEVCWTKAMNEEMSTIEKNKTWKLVALPEGKKIIGLKWVYKIKYNEDGSIQKHKARLVAKGYSQQPEIDYTETYAPVARMETIRTILALAAQLEVCVYQLDVKSAFLNGEIQEEVYVEQPEGFEIKGQEGKVYRLYKALYGLKQTPRAWNSKINSYFIQNGFNRSMSESSLYVNNLGRDFLVVCLYVDDLLYFGTSKSMVEEFKKKMMRDFEMSDLGQMKYFLGIQVKQSPGRIFLSQEKYIDDLLEKFSMNQCKPVSTPMGPNEKFQVNDDAEKVDATLYRKLIGSLIYLNTRPDITQSVSLLSRFMNEPSKNHFTAAKRILRYLKGTKNQGIEFKKENNFNLVGYTDSDWAGSLVDRKSTLGYIFCLGTNIISWSSRKQRSIALSSAQAEYIAAADAACEAIWLRRILKDLMFEQQEPTTIHCDNMSAIAMTKNPVFHARSKHIELRHHFIRDLVSREEICMEFINTNDQPADILTKAVTFDKFDKIKEKLKITN